MGELSQNGLVDWATLHAWLIRNHRIPPPPKIDVRITTFQTDNTLDVLMVIKIDDDKN